MGIEGIERSSATGRAPLESFWPARARPARSSVVPRVTVDAALPGRLLYGQP